MNTWIDREQGLALLRNICEEWPDYCERPHALDGAAVATDRKMLLSLEGLAGDLPPFPGPNAGVSRRLLDEASYAPLGECTLAELAGWVGCFDRQDWESGEVRHGRVGALCVDRNLWARAVAGLAAMRYASGIGAAMPVRVLANTVCMLVVGEGFRVAAMALEVTGECAVPESTTLHLSPVTETEGES